MTKQKNRSVITVQMYYKESIYIISHWDTYSDLVKSPLVAITASSLSGYDARALSTWTW